MKRYITFKDYDEILKIGKLWLERCNNEVMADGTIFHHLPLIDAYGDPLEIKNYSMDNKFRKDFTKDMKAIEKYIKQVEAADRKAIVINYEIMDMRQILPPWIVYPHYPAQNVYLTSYFTLFKEFTNRMTTMELSAYKKVYPTPEYIEQYFKYKETE